MRRLVLLAGVLSVGGCTFTQELERYCAATGQCRCEVGACCVLPGAACEPGVSDCCAGACVAGRCEGGADAGGDAGAPDAGGPDAGEPDAGVPDAGAPDAGTPDAGEPDAGEADAGPGVLARGVSIPQRELDGGGFNYAGMCPAGLRAISWNGTSLSESLTCCTPDGGACIEGSGYACLLPGARKVGPSPRCCFCDEACDTASSAPYSTCPFPEASRIDLPGVISAGEVDAGRALGRCNPGEYAALEGCCVPGAQTCVFDGGYACSLTADPGAYPCCFVVGPAPFGGDGGQRFWSDCRVTGSCRCVPSGGCASTPGAVCATPEG